MCSGNFCNTTLKERLLALGTYKNQVNPLIDECPNELLDKAAYVLDYVEQDRRDNAGRPKPKAATYSWGGWAAKELRHLIEHGEINPRIASVVMTSREDTSQQSLPLDADTAKCPDCQGTGYWYPAGPDKAVLADPVFYPDDERVKRNSTPRRGPRPSRVAPYPHIIRPCPPARKNCEAISRSRHIKG